MVLRVGIEQSTNHTLVLGAVPLGLAFEELHAAFREGNGDLYPLVLQYQVLRLGKKVRNDLHSSYGFIRVSDFRAHRFVSLFANSPHQRFG